MVQVVATLAPNIFHAGFSPAVVMAELERARANILGPEAPEGLGLVLLNWLDYEVRRGPGWGGWGLIGALFISLADGWLAACLAGLDVVSTWP
jgi:hypothetical protein